MATPVRNPYTTHWQYVREFLNPWERKCADMFVLERLVLALLCLALLPTAATLIRYLGGLGGRELRKIVVEFYVVAKTILAVWVLWSNHWNYVLVLGGHLQPNRVISKLSCSRFVEGLLATTHVLESVLDPCRFQFFGIHELVRGSLFTHCRAERPRHNGETTRQRRFTSA